MVNKVIGIELFVPFGKKLPGFLSSQQFFCEQEYLPDQEIIQGMFSEKTSTVCSAFAEIFSQHWFK